MRRRGADGFALMDVLVGTLLASLALVTTLGGIAFAARAVRSLELSVRALIEVENEDAKNRRLVFQLPRNSE